MPRLNVTVDVKIPLLDKPTRLRFERNVSREAVRLMRKEEITPVRKRLPVDTGRLKKSWRASPPKRRRVFGRVVLVAIKYKFWLHFQRIWDATIKPKIIRASPRIIRRATIVALRKEGLR